MQRPLLCATITASSMAYLRRRRDNVRGVDLVELRLDGVADPDVAGALDGRKLPVIVTCRPTWQGGRFDGSEDIRVAMLEHAWELGAEWVDVEDGAAEPLMTRSRGERIVRSFHDFEGMPHDVSARLRSLLASGAQVVKLAVTASRLSDVVELAERGRTDDGRAVLVAMGEAGVPSRLLAARMGSRWTYAGDQVAPGQLSLSRMVDEFGVPHISQGTQVFGLLGRPVSHSLSPAMHNAAFRAAGVDAIYVPLAADSFADFQRFADAFDVRGASVTSPFKVAARDAATTTDAHATATGAVNTLRRRDSNWDGRNTDLEGFLSPLADRDLRGRRVAVLGAGGAARGVASALRGSGAHTTIYARKTDAATAVAAATGATTGPWPPPEDAWDVLVNATPSGTASTEASPLPLRGPLGGRLVYDLVYNPPDTALLRNARACGADTIGGLPMLIAQAAAQFEWWTGITPSVEVMRQAALTRLEASRLEAHPGPL